jgi:hypothetical protein
MRSPSPECREGNTLILVYDNTSPKSSVSMVMYACKNLSTVGRVSIHAANGQHTGQKAALRPG